MLKLMCSSFKVPKDDSKRDLLRSLLRRFISIADGISMFLKSSLNFLNKKMYLIVNEYKEVGRLGGGTFFDILEWNANSSNCNNNNNNE